MCQGKIIFINTKNIKDKKVCRSWGQVCEPNFEITTHMTTWHVHTHVIFRRVALYLDFVDISHVCINIIQHARSHKWYSPWQGETCFRVKFTDDKEEEEELSYREISPLIVPLKPTPKKHKRLVHTNPTAKKISKVDFVFVNTVRTNLHTCVSIFAFTSPFLPRWAAKTFLRTHKNTHARAHTHKDTVVLLNSCIAEWHPPQPLCARTVSSSQRHTHRRTMFVLS